MAQHLQLNQHDTQHEDKNRMTISMDAENTFDKIQHPFMIKTLNQVDTEGTCLNT